jgi:hypothetical protein
MRASDRVRIRAARWQRDRLFGLKTISLASSCTTYHGEHKPTRRTRPMCKGPWIPSRRALHVRLAKMLGIVSYLLQNARQPPFANTPGYASRRYPHQTLAPERSPCARAGLKSTAHKSRVAHPRCTRPPVHQSRPARPQPTIGLSPRHRRTVFSKTAISAAQYAAPVPTPERRRSPSILDALLLWPNEPTPQSSTPRPTP